MAGAIARNNDPQFHHGRFMMTAQSIPLQLHHQRTQALGRHHHRFHRNGL